MKMREIMRYVDHTQLKAYAAWEDIRGLCEEAVRYGAASVCIPSCYVKRVRETFGDALTVCTVVGFPLGYCNTEGKLAEAGQALADGADEIDMVINIADVKNGDYGRVEEEIRAVKQLCGSRVLKVIVEACYLDEQEKIAMCGAVTRAEADYIKTSTGFGSGGAAVEDVKLFKRYIGPDVKIKAAGGISTPEEMERFLELGCSRIGTSRAAGLCRAEE